MKKFTFYLICILCFLNLGCFAKKSKANTFKMNIVCTSFPEYDWTRNVLGLDSQDIYVHLLIKSGIDLHSFQPTVADIATISKCNMFVYTGTESATWVQEILKQVENKNMIVINTLDYVEPIMVDSHHKEEVCQTENHKHTTDEHIWLSIKNAKKICQTIYQKLCILDSQNQQTYKTNLDNYLQKLDSLDNSFAELTSLPDFKPLIFCDRFPFAYFVNDYNLKYFAPYEGCSSETEASFDTLKELSNVVKEDRPAGIFVTETGDDSLAKTVIANSGEENIDIIKVNSMQSIPKGEGRGYLEIMEENLNALKKVLK
jgi:zinc transport system substrate-binding protein